MLKNISKQKLIVFTDSGKVILEPNQTIKADLVKDVKGLLAYGVLSKVKVEEPKKEEQSKIEEEPKTSKTTKSKNSKSAKSK